MANRTIPTLLCLLGMATLSGCARDMSDLENYIAEVQARKPSPIDPIPQMKPYQPFAYTRQADPSPFTSFAVEERREKTQEFASDNGLRPDFSRNREPLEEFPLDGIRMLGTLEFQQRIFALLSAPDGVIHRASIGDHLGQNFGKIVHITDAEVQLEEIVPNGLGGYVKRPAVVAISEK